ncbi:MAG TPA: DUF802 domain-containing protein [Rhodoferax sp.]|nr:DUF802 domain-containing protein [Rhodoferax sp.]
MNRHFFTVAFLLGAIALVWVGAGFIGSNILALTMTAIIGAVYVFGMLELRHFRQASTTLTTALTKVPDQLTNLADWLDEVHPSLQNAVRLRIEGERIGLPGPALTPYLVGLLVMLGMLGTFLGMVVTLNGAASSLDGTTDLQAMRFALAAPIKGLGLAFGTSVAGVASSAMLGLMAALSRHERMSAAQLLDTKIATRLLGFSLRHQRQEAYKALQLQSQALPAVVDKLQTMMEQMQGMSQQLNERLLSNQETSHNEVKVIYSDLASSVAKSLSDSLAQSTQAAGQSIKPIVEAAMAGLAQEARSLHQRVIDTTQMQLDGLSQRFNATAVAVTQTWTASLANHERTSASMVSGLGQSLHSFTETFEQHCASLLASVNEANSNSLANQTSADQQRQQAWMQSLASMATTLQRQWHHTSEQTLSQQQQICTTLSNTAQEITEHAHANVSHTLGEITRLVTCSENLISSRIASEADSIKQNSERMDQLARILQAEFGALRDDEAQRGHAAVARLGQLQDAVASHLTTLGTALEGPITRLIETASAAPRAAADVIGQLRLEMSNSILRDNELLQERSHIMETLNSLLNAIRHAADQQRSDIDSLVVTSAAALSDAGSQFSEKVDFETTKLSEIAAHVTSSAVEVSSLSESFGFAVHSFNAANEKMIESLQRIEAAMNKSTTRSDEQLAYYVAQAREIIDLSTMSQRQVFEELHQLSNKQARCAQEVN